LDNCAHFGAVIEHSIDVASAEHGFTKFCFDGGQVEEIIINASNLFLREEGGYKVTLAVEPALWRFFEHGFRRITKVDGGDSCTAAIHKSIIEPDGFDVIEGFVHFWRIEFQFASHPLVIIFGGGHA